MKNFRTIILCTLALVCAFASTDSAMAAKKPKKPKGIILVEGDKATLTVGDKYTTIEFPAKLEEEDFEFYKDYLVDYLMNANAPIRNDGKEYANYNVFYYMHNSREWLHKGQYNDPAQITVSRIQKINISKRAMRLKDFYKEMPLISNSQEKKTDQAWQDEIMFGQEFYTFIEIVIRDVY